MNLLAIMETNFPFFMKQNPGIAFSGYFFPYYHSMFETISSYATDVLLQLLIELKSNWMITMDLWLPLN